MKLYQVNIQKPHGPRAHPGNHVMVLALIAEGPHEARAAAEIWLHRAHRTDHTVLSVYTIDTGIMVARA